MKTRRGFLAAAGGLFSGLAIPSAAQAWGFRRRQVVCPPAPCPPAPCAPPVRFRTLAEETGCWMCMAPDYCYLFFGGVYYYECCICPSCFFIADGSSTKDLEHCDDCNPCGSDSGGTSCETDRCICVSDPSGYGGKNVRLASASKMKLFPGRVHPAKQLSATGVPDLPKDTMPMTALPAGHKCDGPPGDVTVSAEDIKTICYKSPHSARDVVVRVCSVQIKSSTMAHLPRTVNVGLELTGINCADADVKGKGFWLPSQGKRQHLVADHQDPKKAKNIYDVITRNVD